MMWLKACPKCGGDLFPEWDLDGPHVACLQCGHSLSNAELDAVKANLACRARQAVAARQREFAARPHVELDEPTAVFHGDA